MIKPKQWKITVTVDENLYKQLEDRAKKEERSLANLVKYLFLKGLSTEDFNNQNQIKQK